MTTIQPPEIMPIYTPPPVEDTFRYDELAFLREKIRGVDTVGFTTQQIDRLSDKLDRIISRRPIS